MNSDKNIVLYIVLFLSIITLVFYNPLSTSFIANRFLVGITFEHDLVHRGQIWSIYDYMVLENSEINDFIFYTGDKEAHVVFQIQNQFETEYLFCEDANVLTNGTKIDYYNRNRKISGENGVTAYLGGSFDTCGIIFGRASLGQARQTGGADRSINEFVLKPNSIYAIRAANLVNQDNVINYYFEWYEFGVTE